jgi:hypothetical protein
LFNANSKLLKQMKGNVIMEIKISVPKAPSPPVLPPTDVPPHASIIWEQFPRVGERITLMWGSVELQKYLNNIIIDERGDRHGFPAPVLSALLQIYKRHAKMVPEEKTENIWNIAID